MVFVLGASLLLHLIEQCVACNIVDIKLLVSTEEKILFIENGKITHQVK